MKVIVLPADTYVVSSKAIISEYSRKILSILYQPLMGANATNLYFLLWSNLDMTQVTSLEYTHHFLMSSSGYSIDDIIEAREKLEGLGLLKVYINRGSVNRYVYELYSPLDANEFLNHPILNTALFNTLGAIEYDKVVSYFTVPKLNLRNYEEITSSFHEVFDFKASTPLEQTNNIRKNSKLGLTFKPTIDLNNVLSAIPEEMVEQKKITKDIKDFLYKIAFVYNLNDEEMIKVIRYSIDDKHFINKEMVKENCRKTYTFENNGKLPSIMYKNQPEFLRKEITDTSKRTKCIYTMETTSPYEFLMMKNNNVRPSKSDLNILEMLLMDFDLPPGVVNVLIDYVLKINNNKLIKTYVETIATQWKRSNVKTVEDAMALAMKENKTKEKKEVKRTTKVKEEKPNWFDKNIEAHEASDEEVSAFMEKLKYMK